MTLVVVTCSMLIRTPSMTFQGRTTDDLDISTAVLWVTCRAVQGNTQNTVVLLMTEGIQKFLILASKILKIPVMDFFVYLEGKLDTLRGAIVSFIVGKLRSLLHSW